MRVLVLYGTSEGQTRKIAEFVSGQLKQNGQEPTLVNALSIPADLKLLDFDAAIIAARVHSGAYQRQVVQFARRNRNVLAAMPNAFLSVSMSAANLRPGDLRTAESYVRNFVRISGWTPQQVLQVAGARLYTRHGVVVRWILGVVDRHLLDTRKDHEWTDWAGLSSFVTGFVLRAQNGGLAIGGA